MRLILLTQCLISFLYVKPYAQQWQHELDSVLTVIASQGLFNGQILLSAHDSILFNKAYGVLDGHPITVTTALPIASIHKTLTAVGVMMLEEQGKLQYDDPVTDFLPMLPYKDVSIRHLLNQTSDIPNFLTTAIKYGDTSAIMKAREILDLVSRESPMGGTPGQKFHYNNSNYFLARRIIEAVTDTSLEDYMMQNVFNPLGMRHTYIDQLSAGSNVTSVNADNFYQPDGEAYSTTLDLFRFSEAVKHGDIIRGTTRDLAFTAPNLEQGSKSNYGFGWYIQGNGAGKSVGHWGRGEASRSYLELYLSEHQSLIMLTVDCTAYVDQVYALIRNIWEGKSYEIPTKFEAHKIDPNALDKYVGSYLTPQMGLLHITAENGKLYLRPDPIPGKEELVPLTDSTFTFRDQDVQWQFYLDSQGEIEGFGFEGDPSNMGPRQSE